MLIKKLRLRNIRSYIDEEIIFPEGSTLLSGDVGSGKSTVLLSIDFSLFGTRRGEISGSELLRHGSDSGSVELDFILDGKKVKIKRSLKRGKNIVQDTGFLEIDNVREELTATELKARIMEMFGYPKNRKESIFRYTVYTPQEEMKYILMSEERLPVLRKIFGIDKYGIVKENCKIVSRELRTIKREHLVFVSDLVQKESEKKNLHENLAFLSKEKERTRLTLTEIDRKISVTGEKIKETEKTVREFMELRQNHSKKEAEISSRKRALESLFRQKSEMEKRLFSYKKELEAQQEIKEPEKKLSEIKEEQTFLEKERTALLLNSASLRNDISKLSSILDKGLCQVCGQKVHEPESFSLQIHEKRKNYESMEARLKEIMDRTLVLSRFHEDHINYMEIYERKKHFQKSVDDVNTDCQRTAAEIEKNEKEIIREEKSAGELKKLYENMKDYESELSSTRSELERLMREKIAEEKNSSRIEQQLSDLNQRLEKIGKEIIEKKKTEEKISYVNTLIAWLEEDFSSMLDSMEKSVMNLIQKEFDEYFKSWFDIIMEQENLAVRIDESFSPVIEQNGFETEYINLSGGEKTAVALAYRLSLNKVINSLIENIKTKDILILDEPTDGFSSSQLDRIRYVIEELGLKQIIMVSHEPKIDTFVDHVIKIYKENHSTKTV